MRRTSLRHPRLAARLAAGVLLLAAAAACASSQGGASATQAGTQRAARYTITAVELAEAGTSNVYDAIVKLRPEFLRERGTSTISAEPMPSSGRSGAGRAAPSTPNTGTAVPMSRPRLRIYDNDALLENVDALKRIPVDAVIEVRYVPGPEAAVKYGTNHAGGALFVKTR